MFGSIMFPGERYAALGAELNRLRDFFDNTFARSLMSQPASYPAVNVWDAGETICVEAEVPGVRKDDLEILAVGNELTIKGSRKPFNGEKWTYHRHERPVGEFTRSMTLPAEVDADKVEAVLDNGVLTLRLPKAAAARPRQITVKSA